LSVSAKGAGKGGGRGLTEFAVGMLDISTGLLKGLPEKPVVTRSVEGEDSERPGVEVLSTLSTAGRNSGEFGFSGDGAEDHNEFTSPSSSSSGSAGGGF